MTEQKYTAALAKGLGILEETFVLLQVWKPGISGRQLADVAIKDGILGKATAKRAKDLVAKVFVPRYLVDNGRPAEQLKNLLNEGLKPVKLGQILLIHTARANAILHDFISEVYWDKYSEGGTHLTKEDALSFLEKAYHLGRLSMRWSEQMTLHIASNLIGCLTDFQLVENRRKSTRQILPLAINPLTSLYLAHDLHFSGKSDNAISEHPDWRLFGLGKIEVVRELQRASNDHFILQFSGELLKISWKYQSMEEAIRGIARSEL